MDADQLAAFRLARHGLDARRTVPLAAAAACPASDFQRGSALLALAARADGVTREGYDEATDSGDLVLALSLRAAIHALAPADFALLGRALIAAGDDEALGEQLGRPAQQLLAGARIAPSEALSEVAEATARAVGERGALSKDQLHAELRERVRDELLPWCKGCESHHVPPMLWRFAGVQAGTRLDSRRRYVAGSPGEAPDAAEAVRRFLRFYGPATVKDFVGWAGVARAHGRRLWSAVGDELVAVEAGGRRLSLLAEDEPALASPPAVRGVRLLPPRDPYLQHPDRAAVSADPAVRKRLFRPVAGPGAVIQDGRLAGLWRARARGKRAEVEVEALERIDPDLLEAEAARVAELRGAERATVKLAG